MTRPHGVELLRIAGATVLEELVPRLAGQARYAARMTASAIAIARREIADGGETDRAELRRLAAFYDEPTDDHEVRTALGALERRLVRDLRAGVFAESREAALRELLHARLRARLRISNPRRLLQNS